MKAPESVEVSSRGELDSLPVGSIVFDPWQRTLWIKKWQSKGLRRDGTPLSEWIEATHPDETVQTGEITVPAELIWMPSPTETDR